MDRCDFCSIMTCLKNHISESNQMSQPEFLYEIFSDFMDSQEIEDFSLDNGLVCRWMTGQAKISPKISSYYAKPSKQELLAETMEQNLLPLRLTAVKPFRMFILCLYRMIRSQKRKRQSCHLCIKLQIHSFCFLQN